MQLSTVLLNAALLFSSLGGATTVDGHEDVLEVRAPPKPKQPMPGLGEFKAQMEHIDENTCVFYSGLGAGSEGKVKKLRDERDYLRGYKILDERWTDRNFIKNLKRFNGTPKQFFAQASLALAQSCSGVVYVFLPEGDGLNWDAGTIWDQQEWPGLPKGAGVTEVIRLNANDASHKETIYKQPGTKRANEQCSISLTQWDQDKTTNSDRNRFALEFDVKNAAGNVIGHQTRVSVGDWTPFSWLGGNLFSSGLVVIPNDNKVSFWFLGVFWQSSDDRCKVGNWVDGTGESRNREIVCNFAC
ncbi:hypothetical protein JX265_012014 [Neoarthrinium moseri]|uniref:Uncharacterized protein n=1 Tax=Neoarthrinium moseri TaxID=1658444 RepID=A0A9P9WBG2_9PEZI|nr:uncharacterized protein JN550_005908 [Neoarthrinium moseri]KAI1842885.1 hypothetical protein JX266_010903 [Neoarthrinium moseri]KAI1855931.1 hypothetical protein JX265_012014 [Neoarthrinium moseri]KAI1869278.1 hypothetical protein JN550_005908 [Neoarthrinium moseri]